MSTTRYCRIALISISIDTNFIEKKMIGWDINLDVALSKELCHPHAFVYISNVLP